MTFWYELIQAKTMIPVFFVHLLQRHYTRHQSWVGMIHSFISYMMHLFFWWHDDEDGSHTLKLQLYTADKCLILAMMWGFHYHFDPRSAKIVAFPVALDIGQIMMHQHHYFMKTRFAYFDMFLLIYVVLVSLIMIYFMKTYRKMAAGALLLFCMIGYGIEIHGLMHLMLAPGFWLCYEEMKTRNKQPQQATTTPQEEKKNIIIPINNKKEHEL